MKHLRPNNTIKSTLKQMLELFCISFWTDEKLYFANSNGHFINIRIDATYFKVVCAHMRNLIEKNTYKPIKHYNFAKYVIINILLKIAGFLFVRNSQQGALYDVKHSLLKHSRTHPIFIRLCMCVCAIIQILVSYLVVPGGYADDLRISWAEILFFAYFILHSDFTPASKSRKTF